MKQARFHYFEGCGDPDVEVLEGLPSMVAMAAVAEKSDARVFRTDCSGRVLAHAALWWSGTPAIDGRGLGAIGGVAAKDAESATELLNGSLGFLKDAGCRIAVGPMNGNTWRRHRLVVESDGRGPFLLEPRNCGFSPAWWTRAGFRELSRYSSSVLSLDGGGTVPPSLVRRLGKAGVVVRELDLSRYDDELRGIHALCLKSFSGNFLYTPLDEESFLSAYRMVRDRVNPAFVRIAERDGVPCGFVFAIRDLEAEARGETPALIVKTLAVDPEARCAGLGSLLVDEVHRLGFENGYLEAIHALQYETNTSLKITSRHGGRVFRRYALFAKDL